MPATTASSPAGVSPLPGVRDKLCLSVEGNVHAHRFTGRTALVVGAGAGIGRATASRLASEGAKVVCLDVSWTREDSANAAHKAAGNSGGSAVAAQMDATNDGSVDEVMKAVIDEHGPIHTLVNCVGGGRATAFVDIDSAEFERMFRFNVKSTFLCCHAVLPHMYERREGKIVNLSAGTARSGGAVQGAHEGSSKAAVVGLTRHLAREFGPYNININAVAPGLSLGERAAGQLTAAQREAEVAATPLRRLARPEDVSGVIAFLASEDARHITGVTLDVSGGFAL